MEPVLGATCARSGPAWARIPSEALGGWCLLRSSKPLSGAGFGVGGGFDSHALPPTSLPDTSLSERYQDQPVSSPTASSADGACLHGGSDVLGLLINFK